MSEETDKMVACADALSEILSGIDESLKKIAEKGGIQESDSSAGRGANLGDIVDRLDIMNAELGRIRALMISVSDVQNTFYEVRGFLSDILPVMKEIAYSQKDIAFSFGMMAKIELAKNKKAVEEVEASLGGEKKSE